VIEDRLAVTPGSFPEYKEILRPAGLDLCSRVNAMAFYQSLNRPGLTLRIFLLLFRSDLAFIGTNFLVRQIEPFLSPAKRFGEIYRIG
jgi:hypothetical protein